MSAAQCPLAVHHRQLAIYQVSIVNSEGSHLEQVSEEVVTQVLGGHKDEYLAVLVELSQDLQQPQEAVSLRPDLNQLCDVLVHD